MSPEVGQWQEVGFGRGPQGAGSPGSGRDGEPVVEGLGTGVSRLTSGV